MDALNTMMTIDEPAGAEPRRSRVVPAARFVTIDYRSIVEGTVAGLAENTPEARRGVYAQARTVVHRHLQLMRLPEPIVEMEKLALDLTIRKIEREARATDAPGEPTRETKASDAAQPTVSDSLRALRGALAQASRALIALMAVLGLQRLFRMPGLFRLPRFLQLPRRVRPPQLVRVPQGSRRPKIRHRPQVVRRAPAVGPLRAIVRSVISPVGLAAGLPITAMMVIAIFLMDGDTGVQSTVTVKAAQFLERVDVWLHGPAPGTDIAAKDEERMTGDGASGHHAHDARARFASRNGETSPAEGGGTAPRSASGSSSGAAKASTALPRWFTGYTNLVEAGAPLSRIDRRSGARAAEPPAPTADAAASHAGTAPPEDSIMAPEGAEMSTASLGANSLAAVPDDRPAITLTPLRNPAPKATALIDAGKKAALSDDLEKAVADFTEAARIDPNHPSAYTERGQALFKLGETDRAIADYSAALKKDPNFGPALRGRAMANLYRGSTELAFTDLSKAIQIAEIDPARLPALELFYARRSRANIYGTKAKPEGEVADCTALIDSYKRDKALKAALIEVYQPDGAANVVATIYRQRANAYIRVGKPELARDDLTAAVLLSSDRGFSALLDRARLNEAMGQREQAIADLQAALSLRPSNEEARIALRRISSGPPPGRGPGRN
jgi:tetratricopeptide (TPR) repeat protein